MTTDELALAQFLKVTAEAAERHGDQRADQRATKGQIVKYLDAIKKAANGAFFELTGVFPSVVQMHELDTTNPAEWARAWKPRMDS